MRVAVVARLLAAAVLTFASSTVSAATITSNVGFGLDWSSAVTWQGGQVPGPTDNVVIGPGSSVIVSVATSATVNSVVIQAGATISPSDAATLTVDGTLTVTTGTTVTGGAAGVAVGGTSTLAVGGTLSTASLDVNGGSGSATGNGGAAYLNLTTATAIVNVAADMQLLADHSLFDAGMPTVNWFPSGGTIDVNGNLDVLYGTVNLDGGALKLAGNFYGEGEIINGGTSTVTLDGIANQNWTSATVTLHNLTLTNASADINFDNAAVTFDASLEIAGTLTLQGGIFNTSYGVTINSLNGITRTSGHVSGTLMRSVTGGSNYLFPVGTYDLYLPATVTPSTTGVMTVEAYNDVVYGAGPNTLGANWAMQGDGTLTTINAVTFGYAGASVNGNEASYVLARQDYTAWPVTWERYPTTLDTVNDVATMSVPNTTMLGYWTLAESPSVTAASQLVAVSINGGLPTKQNTPFDIVYEARDGQGNPATISQYQYLELGLATTPAPSGTLTDVEGNVVPIGVDANAGAQFITVNNLVYTATGTVSLELKDPNFTPIFTTVTTPVTFGAPDASLTVTSSDDDGAGTLRHAIHTANLGGCTSTPCPIGFNLPVAEQLGDGTWTITVPSSAVFGTRITGDPLPYLDVPVILNGTTQPGFNPADPRPVVTIDGDGGDSVLVVNAAGSTIRGLALHNTYDFALILQGTGNHTVHGCHLGFTAGGAWNDDTYGGLLLTSNNNVVGGTTAAERNVISGNWASGIELYAGASQNQVRGNYIGTDRGGANDLANTYGIVIDGASSNSIKDNLISGNGSTAIWIDGTAASANKNKIEGNTIGYDISGNELINGSWAVEIYGANAVDNVIGDPTAGQGNQIVGGVYLGDQSLGTAVIGNEMSTNWNTPILLSGFTTNDAGDADVNATTCAPAPCTDANNGQNTPVISSAALFGTELRVGLSVDSSAVAATQSIRVEVFRKDANGVLHFIGNGCYATNFVNAVSINIPAAGVVAGDFVYASATSFDTAGCAIEDGQGNHLVGDGTSQLSAAATVTTCGATAPTITASGPTSFCTGSNVTLTASAGASYVWKKDGVALGQTGQQIAVSSSGSYSVIVTDAGGCSAESAPTTVNVFTTPVNPPIGADSSTTFCSGGSVVLRTSTGWASYQWFKDNAILTGANSDSFTATVAGNYTVTTTNANGCSATSSAIPVTVTAAPAPPTVTPAGPTTFCSGGSVVLTSSAASAYQWLHNGSPITGANAQAFTASATGNYSVVIDNGNGCTATSSVLPVTVNSTATPTITANGATTFCEGGNVTLTASNPTGTYQWFKNNNPIGGATARTYSATIAGNYTVTVTENGCPSAASAPVTVTTTGFTPTISAPSTTICNGGSVVLTASAGTAYQWYFNHAVIPGANAQSHTATQPGDYKVHVESNGCANFTAPVTLASGSGTTPTVTASGPTSFCSGGSVTLTSTPAQSYQWSRNGLDIPFATQQSYVASDGASFTVRTTDAGGCVLTSAPVSVTVTPAPETAIDAPASVMPNTTGHTASVTNPIPAASYAWSITGGTLESNAGPSITFNAGSSGNVTLTVTATNGACTFTTSRVIAIDTLDADVAVTKSAPASVATGDTIDYSITVTNHGPAAATNLFLTDPLPAGTTLVSVDASWQCALVGGAVICRANTLAADTTDTIHIHVTAPRQATTITNTVSVEGSGSDPNAANNSASATTTITSSTPACATVPPSLLAPANGATVPAPVTFTWTAVAGATSYELLTNGALAGSTASTSLTTTLPAGPHTWSVVARLGNGCAALTSAQRNLTIEGAVDPTPCGSRVIATPIAPANGATINSSSIEFRWTAAAGAKEYRLWASLDGSTPAVIGITADTALRTTIARGQVTWWVESLYAGCASTESQRVSFVIPAADNCGTARPEAISPRNTNLTNGTVTFSWSGVAGALTYELWLAHNGGTPTLIATTTATSFTAEVPAGQLDWFVRVLVDRCPPRDSQTASFTYTLPVACDANVRPIASSPLDGAEVVSPASFNWSTPAGATKYELYVIRGRGAAQLVATTTSDHADNIQLPNGSASWFVRAYFASGCPALDSSPQQLEVVPRPAACATPDAPVVAAPGQITSGEPFRVQWTSDPAATQYELQLASNADFIGAETVTTGDTAHELVRTNSGNAPLAVYARVRAINTRCSTAHEISAFGSAVAVFILPPTSLDGGATAHERGSVLYTIPLGSELAGQSFTATSAHDFITVTPASGVVPASGMSLEVRVDTSALHVGTTIGSITVTLSTPSARGAAANGVTSVTTPITINLVTPITPTPKNSPPPDALIIPAVAHANGINSQFQSDIRVSNTSPQLMKYQLTFTPSGDAGISAGRQTTFSIDPGRTVALDDVLKSWFGTGTASVTGTLEVRPLTQTATSVSNAAVGALANLVTFASSRTFNVAPTGTFGQFIPAVPFANFIDKSKVLSLQQIAHSAQYRTNLGLVEGSGEPAQLLVKVFGSTGSQLAQFPVSLNGGQHLQLNGFIAQQGIASLDDGRVEVHVTGGNGKVTAYASVLDNATSDPLLVTPVTLGAEGNTRWVVPGVADLSNGTANWQSDVRLFNAGTTPANATLSFYSMNGGEPKTTTMTLQPGEVRQLDRALSSVFNVSQDGGAMHIETATAARLIATARTYNQTSQGTYGQFISAVTPAESVAVGSRPLQLLQVEESSRYRSNIGLAEVTGKPVTLEVSVVPPDAKFAATTHVTLAPNEFRQITSMLTALGLGETYNARITVKAIAGEGRATAYASVIDQKTQDPTYVPAQ